MADQPTPSSAATPDPETTIAKDQDLGINQPASALPAPATPPAASSPSPAPVAPPAATPVNFTPPVASAATAGSATDTEFITAPETTTAAPVTISSQEAAAAATPASKPVLPPTPAPAPAQPLNNQVEQLQGHLGSLQGKVDTLKTSVSASVMPPAPDPIVQPPKIAEPPAPAKMPAPPPAAPSPVPEKSAVATFQDIFPKTGADNTKADTPPPVKADKAHKTDAPAPVDGSVTKPSEVGIAGEVVSVFGILVLALLLLGPFYRALISINWFDTLTSIGWLVAPVSLLLGFLLMLFAKKRWLFKLLVLILLAGAGLFYWALYGHGGLANSVNSLLGWVISYYR